MPSLLCRRRARAPLALALLLASVLAGGEASAFCRTTTVGLPASYSPTRGCFTEGLLLFWGNACVGYSINAQASERIGFADATRIIDASFATWASTTCAATGEKVGISVSNLGAVACSEVRYNKEGPNQNVIVFRDDAWPYNDPNNTLGLTTVTFNADTGEIFDADMEINASGKNLTITDEPPANGFDLASVVTHEAGHFYGLAHATDSKSTMFASYKPGTTALRSLSQDDIDGLCAIYPNAATRTVSPSVPLNNNGSVPAGQCDTTPRHGFTSKCDEPPKPKEGCASAGRPGGDAAGATVLFGTWLVLRRLRRRRRM
jgi:matrixin